RGGGRGGVRRGRTSLPSSGRDSGMTQWFNDRKISTKLLAGFALVLAITAAIGAIGVLDLGRIADADTRLYEENTVAVAKLGDMREDFQRMRVNILHTTRAASDAERDRLDAEFERLFGSVNAGLQEYERYISTDRGRALLETAQRAIADYAPARARLAAMVDAGAADAEVSAAMEQAAALGNAVDVALDDLTEREVE